jgi:hypothetical protein
MVWLEGRGEFCLPPRRQISRDVKMDDNFKNSFYVIKKCEIIEKNKKNFSEVLRLFAAHNIFRRWPL